MVTIPLGLEDWASPSENVSRLRLHNMYLIENPSSPDGISRVSRPTLDLFATVGVGPIYGVWRQDATFGNDWLVVSAGELYRFNQNTKEVTLIGAVPGTDRPQFAGTTDRVIVVRNGTAYSTDGNTLSVIVLPDDIPPYEGMSPPVQSVAVINSTFLLTIKNTQRFYWINPGKTDPDPLDFASAERTPDPIETVAILQDEIWFIGTAGAEVWGTTTDPVIPFQRINGRVYNEGSYSRDTLVNTVSNNLPCLMWVTSTNTVVMAQGSVKRISSGSVEEALGSASDFRAWSFRTSKHDFYILTADKFTYVYDLNTDKWMRWDTYLLDNWLAHVGVQVGATVYAGSYDSNKLYKLVDGSEDDGLVVVREVSGMVPNQGKPIQCASVAVRVNAGWSPSYDFYPNMELRWSDDQGTTWSNYVQISLGNSGFYNADTIFRSLGLVVRPCRLFEFRFAERTRFRLDYAVMNEV